MSLRDRLTAYKGSVRAKRHLSLGISVTGLAPVIMPEHTLAIAVLAVFVNLIWIWEG